MFDTINGLPLHPLAVHAVVVLLPLAAILTVVVAVRPSLHRFTGWLIGLNGAVMVMTFVAKEAGEALEHRVEQISKPAGMEDHAEWGDRVFLTAFVLAALAVALHLLKNRPGLMRWAPVAAVVVAVLVIGATMIAGDTGAQLVWKDFIANTKGG